MKTASPERVRKAQLALAESYVRVGRSADALRASKQALDGADRRRSAAGAVHAGPRAVDGARRASPDRRPRYQSEASSPAGAAAGGGGTVGNARRADRAERARQPEELGRTQGEGRTAAAVGVGRHQAAGGLRQVQGSDSATRAGARRRPTRTTKKNHGEARYLLGLARYRSGDLAGAIARLRSGRWRRRAAGPIATTPAICASRRARRATPPIRARPTSRRTSRR